MQDFSQDRLNVMIAHASPSAVMLLKALCASIEALNTPQIARSKEMLTAKLSHTRLDLVFFDLSEEMGSTGMLESIRQANPDHHLIVAYDPGALDPDVQVAALEQGAHECVEMPDEVDGLKYHEMRLHLLTLTGLLQSRKRFYGRKTHGYRNTFFMPGIESGNTPDSFPRPGRKPSVVAIASSTGGPEILSRIFSILPGNLNVPILLVQHIPEKMTHQFARSLNEKSELDIFEARHGDVIQPGKVYVAPGGRHMTVSKPDPKGVRRIYLNDRAPVNSVRPSADVLFNSLAASYDSGILAVILTGMGEDGKKGVARMKKKGCRCISQSADTCVVYGMPRAVDDAGLSDERLDPLSITEKIARITL